MREAGFPHAPFHSFIRRGQPAISLEQAGMLRTVLLRLAGNPKAASWVTMNSAARRFAKRFVAGETLTDAVEAARQLNAAGRMVSLDYLGESVHTRAEALAAADTAIEIFDRIADEKLDANVSLKLTQMGLDIGDSLCEDLVWRVVQCAEKYRNFVRIDMEGSRLHPAHH